MTLCITCHGEFDNGGDHWKKQCFDCYRNFKGFDGKYGGPTRWRNLARKANVYITHPSVTKEELDEYIKFKEFGRGWGPVEWKPENWSKFTVWVDSTDFD